MEAVVSNGLRTSDATNPSDQVKLSEVELGEVLTIVVGVGGTVTCAGRTTYVALTNAEFPVATKA